ncbi:NUDIX domain-containing protein [Thalassotalea ponticola]|uniref:NUDIX domain-containing protein n=1 Tax=Thalassotalea ponticola TaxID=1523392 RepID=UPI0025B41D2C|nr:NUDIX domain-containing protein [Thalassotalea ponticola]MDN3653394.1 NUDIX domain-containing protein [Thalassotalea ponticola]
MTDFKKIKQFGLNDFNVHQRQLKYQGFFRIEEYAFSHRLFRGGNSSVVKREIFERGDAVALMIVDKQQQQLLMIEQFRAGALRSNENPWCVEFVAGMFDDDESAIDVAVREAKEEANIDIEQAACHPVYQFLPSPGGCSEKIHLYVAYVDLSSYQTGQHAGLATENEDIMVHKLSIADAVSLMEQGKVNNATTIIGLQWLALQFLPKP